MKNLFIVGGVSGSGKSTVISRARETSDARVISTGDIFNTIVNKLFLINMERDRLRYTNWKVFEPYVMACLCGIVEYIDLPKLVIDTHYAVNSPAGFVPGLNDESIHYLGWTAGTRSYEQCQCVLIDAPVDQIYQRIQSDMQRRRGGDVLSLQYLEEERQRNREFREIYANILGKYVKTEKTTIQNGNIEEASLEFQKMLESM